MTAAVQDLHRRAAEDFGARVHAVGDDQWHLPTPCSDWDVRELVDHLVGEMRWMPPLLDGRTIAEVGDRLEGDQLGGDPKAGLGRRGQGGGRGRGRPWRDGADRAPVVR